MTRTTDAPSSRTGTHRRHRAWRDGGSSVARWDAEVFGWSLVALGAGVLLARAGALLLPPGAAAIVCPAVLWVSLTVTIVWALTRSRPRGVLRFRWVDPVIGLAWGIVARLAQGGIAAAAGEPAWPTGVDVASASFVNEAIAATTVAPVLEEMFFRVVVLVSVYTVARRVAGRLAAAIASLVVSTLLFVAAHALVAPVSSADAASLAVVGVITAACVLATGWVWGAVVVHAVYNLTGIAVVLIASVAA